MFVHHLCINSLEKYIAQCYNGNVGVLYRLNILFAEKSACVCGRHLQGGARPADAGFLSAAAPAQTGRRQRGAGKKAQKAPPPEGGGVLRFVSDHSRLRYKALISSTLVSRGLPGRQASA